MSKTATTAPTFASLARDHGRALASIAGRDNGQVPADPTSVDADGLFELVAGAAEWLTLAHHYDQAEELESAASYLADARAADAADQPALLRQAAKYLADTWDFAAEVADELGDDEYDF